MVGKKQKLFIVEDFFSAFIYLSIPFHSPIPNVELICHNSGKRQNRGNSAVRDDGLFVPEEFMAIAKAPGNAFVWASVMFQGEPRKG